MCGLPTTKAGLQPHYQTWKAAGMPSPTPDFSEPIEMWVVLTRNNDASIIYSDFRVNCYPHTVIDLVTCFCKKGCIAHCFICKPLMMFCTLLCKCKWHASCLNPAIVRAAVGPTNSMKNVHNLLRSGLRVH